MKFKYSLRRPHIPYTPFALRNAQITVNTVVGSLGEHLSFNSYGTHEILDTDSLGRDVEITDNAEANSNFTCLIFDYNETDPDRNPHEFDKLIVHYSIGRIFSYWYYEFYNTKTGKNTCNDTIHYEIDELISHIRATIEAFKSEKLYKKLIAESIALNGEEYTFSPKYRMKRTTNTF